MLRALAAAIVAGVGIAATLVSMSSASAPPVGPLPKSPVTTITTVSQELVSVALPRGQSGLVWRLARPYDSRVVRQLTEANVGDLTVLVYVASKPGTASLSFALTSGDRPRVYRAARFLVTVKPRGK